MNDSRKHIVLGLLAHVDAGKTTLSEALLYHTNIVRTRGRVDEQNTLLDYDAQERERGITIYAKEASFSYGNTDFWLLDTPGHTDFSAEMERTLQVLDMAVLIISGLDGVQAHTRTIFSLLKKHHIPTIFFVNKMDLTPHSKEELIRSLESLTPECIEMNTADTYEKISLLDEQLLESYLENGTLEDDTISDLVSSQPFFPLCFVSALKDEGIKELLEVLDKYSPIPQYSDEMAMQVFKISRDMRGERLSHVKITGGSLKVKDTLANGDKIDQIRIYNGSRFTMVQEAYPGMIVALKGPTRLQADSDLNGHNTDPSLTSCTSCDLILPDHVDAYDFYRKIRELDEEDPQLRLHYNPHTKRISLSVNGNVQKQILQRLIKERWDTEVEISAPKLIYKETPLTEVEGVGHYEPLRHYAEVHLLIEPLPLNSGLIIDSDCPLDVLELNYQKQVLTILDETELTGPLTNSPLTDCRITLVSGRSHLKHTEGGDFREATLRAVRQGLRMIDMKLLEPIVTFSLTIEDTYMAKALFDLDLFSAEYSMDQHDHIVTITGSCPYKAMMNYPEEVLAYTRGTGSFHMTMSGYQPCADQEEVVREISYDPDHDTENSGDSVFTSHGAGTLVPYNEVPEHMHIPFIQVVDNTPSTTYHRLSISDDELQEVINRTYKPKDRTYKEPVKKEVPKPLNNHTEPPKPPCLFIDGYNMIYGWDSLKEMAKVDYDYARETLINMIANYQYYFKGRVVLVFDAYKRKDNHGHRTKADNIEIVYTKSSQTADSYIEQEVTKLAKKYQITVATSDGLIQNIILGRGATRMSARELESRIKMATASQKTTPEPSSNHPFKDLKKLMEEE